MRKLAITTLLPLAMVVTLWAQSEVASPMDASARATFSIADPLSVEGRRVGMDRFVVNDIRVGCDEVSYRGAAGSDSDTLALEPAFSGCTARILSGLLADFYQELCDFVLRDPQPVAGENRWIANVALECSGVWDAVGWDLYETEKKYTYAQSFCGLRIPEQAALGKAVLRNMAGGSLRIGWRLDDFEYEILEPSLVCGTAAQIPLENGFYEGQAVIEGVKMAHADVAESPSEK